jgi:hypothetical protein
MRWCGNSICHLARRWIRTTELGRERSISFENYLTKKDYKFADDAW